MYIPGDVVMNGVYPVHMPGMEPLTCGMLYKNGAMLVEAMKWTIENVNNKNILNGVTLGGLALDDCFTAFKGLHEVTSVRRHGMTVKDSNGNALDPATIDGYHGGYLTTFVLPLAKLMNEIKRPQIAINPTSSEGHDYPYLIYMTYGTDKIIKAYILMLKKLGWHYIQAVHDPDTFSRSFVKDFKEMAGKHGICVVASYEISSDMTGSDIVDKLRRQSTVQPVLAITREVMLNQIFNSLKSQNSSGQFNMITLVSKSSNSFMGYQDVAKGTINIGYRMPDIPEFIQHLSMLTANSAGVTNPWFSSWFEVLYNCSLDATSMRTYTTVCDRNRNVGAAPGMSYPSSVTSAIYGIYAFAFGLHETLKEYCGVNYIGVCGDYRNAADRGERLVEKIKAITFNVDGKTNIQFKNGEINFPLEYYFWNGPNSAWIKVGKLLSLWVQNKLFICMHSTVSCATI